MNEQEHKIFKGFEGLNIPKDETPESLQRTEAWFEARRGRFTASGIKNLMGVTRATSRMQWGNPAKNIDFNDKALKYIYSKAKERQRGKVVETPATAAMRYGTQYESTIKEVLTTKYFPGLRITETGFIEFIKGVAGASPDGLIKDKKLNLEVKAATSWDTLWQRTEEPFDEQAVDFWQIQTQMIATGYAKTMYVIAEPPRNLFEPEITDLVVRFVDASQMHQQAILERCKIGNEIINKYLKTGDNFREIAFNVLSKWK